MKERLITQASALWRRIVNDVPSPRGHVCTNCEKPAPRGRAYCSPICKVEYSKYRRIVRKLPKCKECEVILGGICGNGDGQRCDWCILNIIDNIIDDSNLLHEREKAE